ncbi:unnamed protein product [Phyllotreta striolata]|uniref:E3 ubiquitin-protein ligase RNF10 n=1 Tax=Phyllotreta striolata TaxID=444603 RepID=A0A9N9XRR9_PHYSR|nr:unnamed protein product [Phyllotreta striolata]
MEKKGNRNAPVLKGSATDSKKDGVSSKPWPRGSRRRESPSGSLSAKPEASRKPPPQRPKTFDKRLGSRGAGAVSRNETAWLEPQQCEYGSIFAAGSKKRSLNHLLNFSYGPKGGDCYKSEQRTGGGKRMLATKKHKYNKEHFLQANCQFVVNNGGDYKQYLNDPDALVHWDLIEQVNVQVSDYPCCPICLYPPVAAKMTRCGHIYCWSCILHYLSLSDKPSRKCPICFDNIEKQDLKSVIAISHMTFNTAETVTFKLMKRPRNCLTAYPADADIRADTAIFNMSDREAKNVFSKLLLADKGDILSIIEREHNELTTQLDGDESPERCFIEQAMVLLEERKNTTLSNLDDVKLNDNSVQLPIVQEFEELCIKDSEISEKDETSSGCQIPKLHYFYQASDGQHIYLHSINARMLEHTYGSLEFGPKTLSGKILEKEGGSMTEELRKKLRYLQHLPVTCQFEIAEIQLKSPDVNKETIEYFQEQLEIRKKRRQKRSKEEKRREKRIEVEESRKMGKYVYPNLHLESNDQFPEFGYEPRLRTESESTVPSELSGSPDIPSSVSGPSFAKMLASEKKSPACWPSLKSAASPSEPIRMINATGSNMRLSVGARAPSDSEPEPDDYESVPSFNTSFGDAIAQALLQATKKGDESVPISRKKKRANKKILFATNMACSEK